VTRIDWNRTVLGAIGAMAWVAGPTPLPPEFQPAREELEPDAATGRRRGGWPLGRGV